VEALREYLAIAGQRPLLVEARYRASIVAGMLASLPNLPTTAVRRTLGVGRDADVRAVLERFSSAEARAVMQLLQPWYTLLREGRLRTRYEPQGPERRELKRAVAISRYCVRLRGFGVDRGFKPWIEVWWYRFVVRWRHLFIGGATVGWQGHYNAACFYALLHARVRGIWEAERDAAGNRDAGANRSESAAEPGPQARSRRRAYRHLRLALEEADDNLECKWWKDVDPDLQDVRDLDDERWAALVAHHCGGEPVPGALPARPWGAARARMIAWLALAAPATVAAVVALIVDGLGIYLAVAVLLAVLGGARFAVARAEAKDEEMRKPPPKPASPPPEDAGAPPTVPAG